MDPRRYTERPFSWQVNHHEAVDNTNTPAAESAQPTHDHTSALQKDAFDYTPKVLNYEHSPYETTKHAQEVCSTGPKLTDLTIDVANVHEHETPHTGGTFAERKAEASKELPISNEHYRELVKSGVDHISGHDGYVSLQLRTAFDEAHQSDKTMHSGGKHVQDLINYANAHLCKNETTLGRHGNDVVVYQKTDDASDKGKVSKFTFPLDNQPKVR